MQTTCTQKIVCKGFKRRNLRDYHDFYVQSNILFLAHEFEAFQICMLKYMSLSFLAPGLAWHTKIKLDLITNICILLMVEKGIRGGIYKRYLLIYES